MIMTTRLSRVWVGSWPARSTTLSLPIHNAFTAGSRQIQHWRLCGEGGEGCQPLWFCHKPQYFMSRHHHAAFNTIEIVVILTKSGKLFIPESFVENYHGKECRNLSQMCPKCTTEHLRLQINIITETHPTHRNIINFQMLATPGGGGAEDIGVM